MHLVFIFMLNFLGFTMGNTPSVNPHACIQHDSDSISVPVLDYKSLRPLLHLSNDTTYIVNFWATWCAPCVKELPYFEALHDIHQGEKVRVILVSLDFKKQIETKLYPFLKKNHLKSDVVVLYDSDSNYWINDISSAWSGAIPATLIYKNGKRSFYEQTFHHQEELNDIIKPYLNL